MVVWIYKILLRVDNKNRLIDERVDGFKIFQVIFKSICGK